MKYSKESAVEAAKADLATRLSIDVGDIKKKSITDREFSDMSLGAAASGEMSAQMIVSGWVIILEADGKDYDYRCDEYQLRLHNFKGHNYVIK